MNLDLIKLPIFPVPIFTASINSQISISTKRQISTVQNLRTTHSLFKILVNYLHSIISLAPNTTKKQNFPMRNSKENPILRTLSSTMGQILSRQFFTKNQSLKIFFSRLHRLILKMQNLLSVQVIGSQLPKIQFLAEGKKLEFLEIIS